MRAPVVLALLLAACAEEPTAEPLPVDAAGAPAYHTFAFGQLVPGATAGGAWVGRTPGSTVTFFASPKGAGAGPCNPAGTCLDIASPVRRLGAVTTDRLGRAAWSGVLPRSLPSADYGFQAVEVTPAGQVVTSEVVVRPVGYVMCPAIYAPVCAADRHTYGSECEANAAGWPAVASGPCP